MISFFGVDALLCFVPSRKSVVRRARVAATVLVAAISVGCAHGAGSPHQDGGSGLTSGVPVDAERSVALAPAGPGHVFAYAEDAALDALAYCHLAAGGSDAERSVARFGVVEAVAGGFRYAEPRVARSGSRGIGYRMRPGDVLHFRQLPIAAWSVHGAGANRMRARDRWIVDHRDPLHRPLYLLAPDRRVRVYAGREQGELELGRFEPVSGWKSEDTRGKSVRLGRLEPSAGNRVGSGEAPDRAGAGGREDLAATTSR